MRRIPLLILATAPLVLGALAGGAGAQDETVGATGVEPGRSPVIVELVDLGVPGDAPVLAALLDLQTDGVESTGVLTGLDVMAADVTPEGMAALEAAPTVESVRPAREGFELLLDRAAATIGASELHLEGYRGGGRVVAVIDSGVDTGHPALEGAVVEQACFLQGVPSNEASVTVVELCENGTRNDGGSAAPCTLMPVSCSHGTAVAGAVASRDETFTGVAPGADLIAFRVTAVLEGAVAESDPEHPYSPYIPEAGVLAALERVYALRNTYDISAVNLSLGGPPGDCRDDVWEDVIGRLTTAGIAVVAASGNQGWTDDLSFPACLPDVISVGATTNEGEVAGFTNSSADLDLLAPGSPITSTVLTTMEPSGLAAQDGTSFSAPQVAGAFALVDSSLPSAWPVGRTRNLLRATGEMVARPTANPFDHDPRFPEVRLQPVVDFTPFADAVDGFWVGAADWAKATGVSTGIGGNTFAPDLVLSRAQAVTFLWRFMGSPDFGTDSGFGDVAPSQWYAPAVAWAAATGVTEGTGPGRFSPESAVTRGELATFMWRAVGEPPAGLGSVFVDVDAGAFYATAVEWMALHEITTGTTASTFSPDDSVSRSQMVTFEFRLADAPTAWSGSVAPPELALF